MRSTGHAALPKTVDIRLPEKGTVDIRLPGIGTEDIRLPGKGTEDIRLPGKGTVDIRLPGKGTGDIRLPGKGTADIRLPGKGNSSSHGSRPVHQIIPMMKWIRTSRLSQKTVCIPPSSAICTRGSPRKAPPHASFILK